MFQFSYVIEVRKETNPYKIVSFIFTQQQKSRVPTTSTTSFTIRGRILTMPLAFDHH